MPFEVSGMDATIKMFQEKAAHTDRALTHAVRAGGKLLAEKLKEKAPVDTGALRDSIKPDKVKYNAGDGYHCDVKPTGKHPKTGEPLAKIGNILEYGRSSSAKNRKYQSAKAAKRTSAMDARGWFHPTVKENEREVMEAMRDDFNAEMNKG